MIARNNLGYTLAGRGRLDEAIAEYQRALEIKPDYLEARQGLGLARSEQERVLKMLAQRRQWLRLHLDDVAGLNDLAWLLATSPNTSVRNGTEAVERAQRAVKLSGGQEPAILGTLAAAYAETGRFSEAVKTVRTALGLAVQGKQPILAESIKTKIPLYEAGIPFRQTQNLPVQSPVPP